MQPPQPPYGGPPQPPPGMGPGPGMGGFGPPPGAPGPGMPGWGPPPPRGQNNAGAVIAVILVAALVVVGGVGAGIWWLYRTGEKARSAAVAPLPSISGFPSPSSGSSAPAVPGSSVPATLPSDGYTPPPTYSPPPTYTPVFDPRPGDCVHNSGTYSRPILHESHCTSGNYKILRRYDGTNDRNRCRVGTYAVWYTQPKFILCMRRI